MAFDDDTGLSPAGDGRFEGSIGDRWWTPRGPLGGYVMAIILRGIQMAVDDASRQPRSLTVQFLRPPEAGPVTVVTTIQRSGRSLTNASARLEQGGETLALAVSALSGPWEGPLLDAAPMPEVDPPGERGTTPNPARDPKPPFLDLLSMQPRFGDAPFSGADNTLTGGWLGLVEERPVDALTVVVLADAWFPAPWPRLKALAPAPTIEMSVYFRAPLPLPDSLLLGRFDSRLVRDGFFDENGELWAPDGTLVAQSRQLGLLLGAQV
jgi:acyl-CoA thioesterase